MMKSGLAKLPPVETIGYRGERMSPTEFKEQYGAGTFEVRRYTSVTTNPLVAQGFAAGSSQTPRADQTLSVFCELRITDGRDISEISTVKKEKEILLLAGSEFKVQSTTKKTRKENEAAPAWTGSLEGGKGVTEWIKVTAQQFQAAKLVPQPRMIGTPPTRQGENRDVAELQNRNARQFPVLDPLIKDLLDLMLAEEDAQKLQKVRRQARIDFLLEWELVSPEEIEMQVGRQERIDILLESGLVSPEDIKAFGIR